MEKSKQRTRRTFEQMFPLVERYQSSGQRQKEFCKSHAIRQWHKLIRVLEDGRLEMDNNLIENKIRPLALGRKKYLFAGSHDAAQLIAMMYSFFATCKANEMNPYDWLKATLDKMPDHPVNSLDELLPVKITTFEKST